MGHKIKEVPENFESHFSGWIGAQLTTVPDTLCTGLQNWTETGYFGTQTTTQNKAYPSTELAFPSGLLPGLEQKLIVLMMVSGGTIDHR